MRIDLVISPIGSLFAIAFIFVAVATLPCEAQSTGPIISEGAKFEEVSRAGKVFAEGVVAAKDGKVYLTEMHHKALVQSPNLSVRSREWRDRKLHGAKRQCCRSPCRQER